MDRLHRFELAVHHMFTYILGYHFDKEYLWHAIGMLYIDSASIGLKAYSMT